jgi:hypothetical protein
LKIEKEILIMEYDFGYDFTELNRCKNFSEYDESAWDYFGDDDDTDEYYEICNRKYEMMMESN